MTARIMIVKVGDSVGTFMRIQRVPYWLLLFAGFILALALGRLVYHYVLFQGTLRALTEF